MIEPLHLARLSLADPAETEALGADLGRALAAGDVVFLSGDLGAGKTTLARGLVSAWLGRAEETPSPTYTLIQTYEGPRGLLHHVDLYRLETPEDALELGLEDAFGRDLCVIEWADRLGALAPKDRLEIRLAFADEGRDASLLGFGAMKEFRWR